MIVMVILLPLADRKVCRRLGLSIDDGISTNPDADRLLILRKAVLVLVFCLYLLVLAYVAFFSRSAAADYLVHIAVFEDLSQSIQIDYGVFEFFRVLFTAGFAEAFRLVHVINPEDISQVYMNIAMFIPMGYLLPYVFDWFRRNIRTRTVIVCFLISLIIENLQLATKLGFYDFDDIISNTIGGFLGQGLFIAFAYVNTHPDWRADVRQLHHWRWKARNTALHPFFRKMHVVRATLYCTDMAAAEDFFVKKLGFLVHKKITDLATGHTKMLLYCNDTQIEIVLRPGDPLPAQDVTIAFNNNDRIRARLLENDIPVSEYALDPYTNLRTFRVNAPDNITITFIEE